MNIWLKRCLLGFTLTALTAGFGSLPTKPSFANNTELLGSECQAAPAPVKRAWPDTDFSRCTVLLTEIISGGPGKDGIPPIDAPEFASLHETDLADNEPVISVTIAGETRIYPLQILTWHEIVNDQIADVPIAVTYCPLCNASIVFDRRLDNQLLDFGTTGNLRLSDLVMYDRQTESWFQQYDGSGLFGALAGTTLTMLPARLESIKEAKQRLSEARILQRPKGFLRAYGANPYVGYDTSPFPFLFSGQVPAGVKPLEYVVIADDKAWALSYIKDSFLSEQKTVIDDDIEIEWRPGRASALDSRVIADGRDLGNVTVYQRTGEGRVLIPYKISFAFVWHAFNPGKDIIRQGSG